MEATEYPGLDHLDPLDVMMEDKDILGLIDPEETAEMLRSLQDVLDKDIDMATDSDDVNNNNIAQASLATQSTSTSTSAEQDQMNAEKTSETVPDGTTAAPVSDRKTDEAETTDSAMEEAAISVEASSAVADAAERGRSPRRSTRRIEYNLRTSSILNRIETEQRRKMPKTPKPKHKPPPLSKYRRKTANSRERQRMQEINDAFVDLQNVIPDLPATGAKLTKITTLRLALNYIASLREMLGYDDPLALEWNASGQGAQCTSPAGSVVQSPRTSSTDSDGMSVSTCSPGQRSGLDSEGESSYSS